MSGVPAALPACYEPFTLTTAMAVRNLRAALDCGRVVT
jgi:hypothetical protein